jgi:iron complex transport system substrate-binding protein
MRKLWLLSIITFACLATFIIVSYNRNQGKVHTLNAAEPGNKPTRIISLAPNLTEILFALGLDEKIIAVSSDSDYPPDAADKSKVGTFWQPNVEVIIACQPDLVVALQTEQQKAIANSLERIGYRVLALKIERLDDLFVAIGQIGTATGHKQRADKLISNIRSQLDTLRSKFSLQDKARVLWVVQAEPLRVVGRNTFINEMIELAGGENCIGPTLSRFPQIGSEEILTSGVEVIIQSAMGKNNIDRQQQAAQVFWSKWPNLLAVKNNRIYVIESDTVLRLGPRLPEGVNLIADYLHRDCLTQTNDTTK